MKSSGPLRRRFFFLPLCLCREICWHGWHLFGCVTFLTRFQPEGWEGRREEVAGWAGSCSFTTARGIFFFFSPVRENAKRAAAYNGGVMGEAVRGVWVKDTLGSASRRTSRRCSFVFLAAAVRSLRVRTHKSTMWKNERRETKTA